MGNSKMKKQIYFLSLLILLSLSTYVEAELQFPDRIIHAWVEWSRKKNKYVLDDEKGTQTMSFERDVGNMENYLKGVIAGEMEPNWNIEAYKAQAVAARTYVPAVSMPKHHHPGCDWDGGADVCTLTNFREFPDKIHCQQWSSAYSLTSPRSQAVDQTRGEGLVHRGEWIKSFFYSHDCADGSRPHRGHTNNNEDVWGGAPISYLRQVPCPYCLAAFNRLNLPPHKRGARGHGVGMCQWGACELADRGWNYRKILQHYYTLDEFLFPTTKDGTYTTCFNPGEEIYARGTASIYGKCRNYLSTGSNIFRLKKIFLLKFRIV
jgi:hypothetical protein